MPWPSPATITKAAKVAGGWVRDKVATATDAAVAKAKEIANAVDREAREKFRRGIADTVDALSEPTAEITDGYQKAKGVAVSAKDGAVRAIDGAKKLFGMAPPAKPVQACPKPGSTGVPQDGGLMVPTDDCDTKPIPICGKDYAGALAQAKAASAAAKAQSSAATRQCCEGKSAAERNRTIIYVNGINTTPKSHCATLRKLRDMTCGNVVGILNNTEGGMTDIVRTNDARARIKREIGGGPAKDYPGFSPAVQSMKEVMTLQALSGEKTTIFAHSEGGAITSLATIRAKGFLDDIDESDAIHNLDIVSMGAAAPAWTDGPNYTHYIHVQDVVPNTVGLGDAARRAGEGANVIRFGGRNGDFNTLGDLDKKPWSIVTPTKVRKLADLEHLIDDHLADSSYLEYINRTTGGCFDPPTPPSPSPR